MKRKRVDIVELYKGVSQKSKKIKLGKKKTVKRNVVGISEGFKKNETCLIFSAVNLINTLVEFDLETIQKFYEDFETEYGIDTDGIYVFDVFEYLKEYLTEHDKTDCFEFMFLSNDKLDDPSSAYFADYISLQGTGEFKQIQGKESATAEIRNLLLENYVLIVVFQCNKRMKCLKCGNRVAFKVEEDKTHSIVLLQIEVEKRTGRELCSYLDSEVLGKKSTCNYCKVGLKNLTQSFPKDIEVIAVRRKGSKVFNNNYRKK